MELKKIKIYNEFEVITCYYYSYYYLIYIPLFETLKWIDKNISKVVDYFGSLTWPKKKSQESFPRKTHIT